MGYEMNSESSPSLFELDQEKAITFLFNCAKNNLSPGGTPELQYDLKVALSHLNITSRELRKDERINTIADYFVDMKIVSAKEGFYELWANLYHLRRNSLGIF